MKNEINRALWAKKAKFFIIAALAAVATLSTGCKKDEPEENRFSLGVINKTFPCPHCGKATYYVEYNAGLASESFSGPVADQYVEGGQRGGWELKVNNRMGAYHGFWANTRDPYKIWWTCDSCSTTITAEWDRNNEVLKTY